MFSRKKFWHLYLANHAFNIKWVNKNPLKVQNIKPMIKNMSVFQKKYIYIPSKDSVFKNVGGAPK